MLIGRRGRTCPLQKIIFPVLALRGRQPSHPGKLVLSGFPESSGMPRNRDPANAPHIYALSRGEELEFRRPRSRKASQRKRSRRAMQIRKEEEMDALNRHLIRLVALSTMLGGFAVVNAHEAGEPAERAEKLGTVHFPTSCLPQAQPLFERAVATLHSLWYPETLKSFGQVLEDDPACGIAYSGLAM